MNDIILSALLNLFALFGATSKTDVEKSRSTISSYLSRHFGVRNKSNYLGLYSDLRDFYDNSPDLDKDLIIEGICSNLQHKIQKEEQALLLLRFMEFCNIQSVDIDLFKKVATLFSISESLFNDFHNFVSNTPNENIIILDKNSNDSLKDLNGNIRVLNIKIYNKIVFTYNGRDEVLMNDIPILAGIFLIWEKSGVLKNKKIKPIYYSNIISMFEKSEEVVSNIELCGRDVNFRFPKSENGMHTLSFTLHGGELVAIMGGSGVGKSTLLSLLNGNLTPQEGCITLNGYEINNPKVKDLIGFVPQDDLLIEELTVFQNLLFTAKLCFNDLSDTDLTKKVNKVLYDLGLEAAKDLKVGSAINKYISGGQRKRLNIALELIREPSVLFLDEPTSGLSSTDSEKVINLLREQTFKGRLIVVNIHQPSSDIFKLFDRLWLLDRGGYPVYDGNPIEAVTYFKEAAEYADSNISTCNSCGNINPEIVLNIIDEKSLDDSGKLTDKRKVTPQEWHDRYLQSQKAKKGDFSPTKKIETLNLPISEQKRPRPFKQMLIFLQRNLKTKITNTQYLLISLLEAPLLAVIVAMLTKYAPPEGYSLMENKNLVSYFFMAIIVAIFIGMSGSAEEIFKDRALLKRERFLRLSNNSYIWSKIIFMSGLSIIQTFLFIIVGNSIMGISGQFGTWWMLMFISAFLANLTGLVLSQSLSSIVAIYITIPLLLIPQILLCGLVVKFEDLNPNSKTGNVPIIGEIIPSRWAFEALAVNSFCTNDYEKGFFKNDRGKFEAQYYNYAFQYELESQLETAEKERIDGKEIRESHFDILRNELPRLAEYANTNPFMSAEEMKTKLNSKNYTKRTYDSLMSYFQKTSKLITQKGNDYSLALDRQIEDFIDQFGKEKLIELKRDNYNIFLESLVANSDSKKTHKIVKNNILPKMGYIYITPRSHNGRAPFYSNVKILGNTQIPTLWYNIGVLALMSLITSLALFFDFPGRYIRKDKE